MDQGLFWSGHQTSRAAGKSASWGDLLVRTSGLPSRHKTWVVNCWGCHTCSRFILQGSWGQVLGLPVWGFPSRTAGLGGQSTGCAK